MPQKSKAPEWSYWVTDPTDWATKLGLTDLTDWATELGLPKKDDPEGLEEAAREAWLIDSMQMLKDGRPLIDAIIGQFGRQGENPVKVPASALRAFFKLENDPDWETRVERQLRLLQACNFKFETFGREPTEAYGSLLGQVSYYEAKDRVNGDGLYLLYFCPLFLEKAKKKASRKK